MGQLVFFDERYLAEIAGFDADTILQKFYHDESELVVVFFSKGYAESEWCCNVEWRAIRDLIKKRRGYSILPLRFDDTEIPGVYSIDIVPYIGDRSPQQVAELIEERLNVLRKGFGTPPKKGKPPLGQIPGKTDPSVPHQLPSPPRDFVGREDDLRKLLAGIEGGVAISGLRGMGGIGKTALALVVADRLAGRYPDGQFFLDLRGTSDKPLSAGHAMAHVLRSIDPQAKPPEDEAGLAAAYRSALHPRRTILLMDNARDAAQVLPLVPPPGSILLVSSRWRFAVHGLNGVDLDVLDEQDAVRLLLAIEKRIAEHAAALARLCGYLPLALRAAGSLLQVQRNLSPADYVRQLEEERTRLEKIGQEGVEIGVEACLDLSYRQLPPETAAVFRRLAVFPGSFDAAGEEAVCQDPAHSHLNELLRYSLVDYDEAADRYRLHDLARVFADLRLKDPDRAAAQRRHAEFFLTVLKSADEMYLKGGEALSQGLALFDRERANIEAGQAWACSQPPEDRDAGRLCSAYAGAGAYCLDIRQHPRSERIPWLEAALAAARRLKDRAAEGAHLGNLGIAYHALGEYRKAIDLHEQALIIHREIGDRHGEGNVLGNLGIAYDALGEHRKAIEFHEQALIIHREIGDRRGEAQDLGNLGNAYRALGEYPKGIEFCMQALTIDRETGDWRSAAQTLGKLGNAYHALREYRKAIGFHEQALTICREIGDRRGEGQDLGNLGTAYHALGEDRKAIEFLEQALTIDREIGERRGEGAALGNLGNAYAALGEYRKAIELHEQHLAIAREIGDRRGEGAALFNRGLAFYELGDRAAAIADAEAALIIFEQIEDPGARKVRRRLARWRGS